MEVRKTLSMFFSIALFGACAISLTATASDRGLSFKGALVSGGCDAQASSDLAQITLRPAKPGAPPAFDPGLFRTACRDQHLSLEAHYIKSAIADAKGQAGVVTLTYQ